MIIEFYKYQGNGNDFIMIDGRLVEGELSAYQRRNMCHRRFGIGADGVIFLKNHNDFDFEMKYYNSDGNESSMCGNGGRCIIRFAHNLGIISDKYTFLAIDGQHEGIIQKNGLISLKMNDVNQITQCDKDYVLDTGSPHYLKLVNDLEAVDVFNEGGVIRNSAPFKDAGINVNFMQLTDNVLKLRTYERGVENETLSCGTGVVAAALVSSLVLNRLDGDNLVNLKTPGGNFEVRFHKDGNNHFTNIWLTGRAEFVFKGVLELD